MRKRRETGWGGGGGGVGCGGILPWMSTDRDFFIPITKTSSLSHKGTTRQTGESVAPDWIGHFFFFWWREMSKSGNGFYISSVISRASRWASWVFILQTPNLDLPLHMWMREWSQTALEMWKNQNEPGICLPPPPPQSSQMNIPSKTNEKCVLPGSTRVRNWGCFTYAHVQTHYICISAVEYQTLPGLHFTSAAVHFSRVRARNKTWVWFPSHMVSFAVYMFSLKTL